MIRFLNDETVAGYRHGKGSVATFDTATEAALIQQGDAVAYDTNAAHPYYHFHGFSGTQSADDDKFYDLTGLNHASRGANLSTSQLWTTNAGYASTIDPIGGATDSVLRIPNLNYDYAGGEKLIIWWLGKVTAEGSGARMMGDGYGTTAGQWGIRFNLESSGKIQFVISDAAEIYSSMPSTSISARLASFAIILDGQSRKHGMWIDEAFAMPGGSYTVLGSGAAIDTRNSNTFNVGTSYAAAAASTVGIATATRALAILRLPASYAMPSVGTLTNVFQQLRVNPGKLILASAF
ncbi:MAG: hypothetical protein ABS69_10740 [Nitrosomonadales bacterium SCN 54-20]|nr:MAG: hypothetical protein ABS69_10740 [Nitrosomonadales bacterium SCN 54-20]